MACGTKSLPSTRSPFRAMNRSPSCTSRESMTARSNATSPECPPASCPPLPRRMSVSVSMTAGLASARCRLCRRCGSSNWGWLGGDGDGLCPGRRRGRGWDRKGRWLEALGQRFGVGRLDLVVHEELPGYGVPDWGGDFGSERYTLRFVDLNEHDEFGVVGRGKAQ